MRAPGRRTLVGLAVLLVLVVVGGAAVGLARSGSSSGAARPAPSPAAAGCPSGAVAADSGLKPALTGVVSIGALPTADDAFVGGLSLGVDWADLQPTAGGPLVHPNAVDDAVAALRAAGCARGLKLRVLAGVHSPGWVLALAGGPVALSSSGQQTLQGSVPRFWTAEVGAAYDDLQRRLAEAYDDVPEVREVVMSRCTTFYAEPLLRQLEAGGANAAAYAAAGLDEAADEACLAGQVRAHQVWLHTRSSLALNPYVAPGAVPPRASVDVPLGTARDCRAVLGERCVLANNSIRWPVLAGLYPQLYAGMAALGAPLEFQTAAANRIGDAVQTVRWAAGQGAGSVEMEPAVIDANAAALTGLAAQHALPGR